MALSVELPGLSFMSLGRHIVDSRGRGKRAPCGTPLWAIALHCIACIYCLCLLWHEFILKALRDSLSMISNF
jgi:hypothetical protein